MPPDCRQRASGSKMEACDTNRLVLSAEVLDNSRLGQFVLKITRPTKLAWIEHRAPLRFDHSEISAGLDNWWIFCQHEN